MGPDNGLMSDTGFGTNLPQMEEASIDLTEEKKMARYSKTAEFKRIEEWCEGRISFYQSCLPDGRPIALVPKKDLEGMWIASNLVIMELKSLLNSYELAKEVTEN